MNNRKLKEIVANRHLFGSIDPIEAVLFLTARYTLLPDVFDIFGREAAIEFLERFGGKSIKIPSVKNVEEAIQQLLIWKALQQDESQENYKRLSVKFGLKESEVRASKQRVQDMFNEQRKRFGRPEQDPATEQRSAVDTKGTAEVEPTGTIDYGIATLTTGLYGVHDGVYIRRGSREGEGAHSTVPPGDSKLD